MSNINKSKLNKAIIGKQVLVVLAVLACLSMAAPAVSYAGEGGTNYVYNTSGIVPPDNNTSFSSGSNTQKEVIYYPVTKTNTVTRTIIQPAPAPVTTTVAPTTVNQDDSTTQPSFGALSANAVFGAGNGKSIMPSGIIQWILFAILLIIVIILVRKIFGATDHYHNSPMKHA